MTRSRLRNKFLRYRSDENKKVYNEQRNRWVKLVRSARIAHYSNHNIKDVNDNKIFWKTIKPLFSEKVNTNENITLVNNNNIISSEIETATHSNDIPTKIVKANALFSILVSNAFNKSAISCKFLLVLKLADITPVH